MRAFLIASQVFIQATSIENELLEYARRQMHTITKMCLVTTQAPGPLWRIWRPFLDYYRL